MLEKKNLYKLLLFHEYNRISKFFISLFNWYAVKIQVLLLEKNLFTKKFVREKNYIRTTMRVSSTNLIESITQTFETSS